MKLVRPDTTSALPGDQLEVAVEVGPALDRDAAVAGLYREHALGLVRLAYVMLGSRTSAEDIVQDAFLGLHRRWSATSGGR